MGAEAAGIREARGEGDIEGGRAGDRDICVALPRELLQGGSVVRSGGAWVGAGRPSVGQVRPGEQREWPHAVLLGAEDRRVSKAEVALGSWGRATQHEWAGVADLVCVGA